LADEGGKEDAGENPKYQGNLTPKKAKKEKKPKKDKRVILKNFT